MNIRGSSHRQQGFTLIELMIGMAIGLLISAAAVSAFLAHTRTVYQQMGYSAASEDINEAYAVLSRLVTQAERDTIAISRTVSGDGDLTAITIDLVLPDGYSVWPNDTDPFDENLVRIAWSSTGDNARQITIANAASSGSLPTGVVLAGGSTGNNTRITRVNLSDDLGDLTRLFSISGQSYARELAGEDVDGLTVEGRILPRN